jgi:nitroreductase
MRVSEAITSRKSVRAFLDKPVDSDIIRRILDTARFSPSAVSTQPWRVAVVTGETKRRLQEDIEGAFRAGAAAGMDYPYYPEAWTEPWASLRRSCGLMLYSAVDIRKTDTERRLEQWAANYRAFDAPVMLLFFLPPGLAACAYIDYGMFLQSIMVAAVAEGLATCPQAALREYPGIVRKTAGLPGRPRSGVRHGRGIRGYRASD